MALGFPRPDYSFQEFLISLNRSIQSYENGTSVQGTELLEQIDPQIVLRALYRVRRRLKQ